MSRSKSFLLQRSVVSGVSLKMTFCWTSNNPFEHAELVSIFEKVETYQYKLLSCLDDALPKMNEVCPMQKLETDSRSFLTLYSMPTIQPRIRQAINPPISPWPTEIKWTRHFELEIPNLATSSFLDGTIQLKPPIMIPIHWRLAKPARAYVIIDSDWGDIHKVFDPSHLQYPKSLIRSDSDKSLQ